jgi:Flp pilus assembly protein TadB
MCLPDRRATTSSSTLISLLAGAAVLLACVGAPLLGALAGVIGVAACAALPLLIRGRHRARPSSDDATVASSSMTTP